MKVVSIKTLYGRGASAAYVADAAREGRVAFMPEKEVDRVRMLLGTGYDSPSRKTGSPKPEPPKGGPSQPGPVPHAGLVSRPTSAIIPTEKGKSTLIIREEDVRRLREARERFSVAPVKLTAAQKAVTLTDVVYGEFELSSYQLSGLKEVATYIENKARKAIGGPMLGMGEEEENFIAGVLEHEAIAALQDPNNSIDWYQGNLDTAMRWASRIHPDIATEEGRFLFSLALAITSNGTKVRENVALAFEAYDFYKRFGLFPGIKSSIDALRASTMASGFNRANGLIRSLGIEKFRDSMLTKMPAGMIRDAFGLSSISENVTEEVYGGIIFGPKIGGGFLPNLNGKLDALTIDRWLMRTIGRITGNLIKRKGEEIQIDEDSDIDQKSGLLDAPRSGGQRAFIRRVFANVQKRLRDRGIDAEIASLQALFWYPEKIYWQALGVKSERGLMTDYGAEAKKYVEAKERGSIRGAKSGRRRDAQAGEAGEQVGRLFSVAPSEGEDAGVYGEIIPGEGALKERFDALPQKEKGLISRSIATSILSRLLVQMGVEHDIEHSVGGFENSVSPNFIVHLKNGDINLANEVARVIGYVFDQKAMIAYDERIRTGDGLTTFVTISKDGGLSAEDGARLFNEIREEVSADVNAPLGFSVKSGKLIIGNFTDATDERFLSAVRKAVGRTSTAYDVGTVRFRSDWIEPESAEKYLEGTRYGNQELERTGPGRDHLRRVWRRDVDALRERAAKLLEGWIEEAERRSDGASGRSYSPVAGGSVRAEYGQPREGSIEAVGHHFSRQWLSRLSGHAYGSSHRGAEWRRVVGDPELSSRIYFYVDLGEGIFPESMVGPNEHVVRLRNLYDKISDPLSLVKKSAGDWNKFEHSVIDAGFDGYLTRIGNQGFAVLIGKRHTNVPVDRRPKFSVAGPNWKSPLIDAVSGLKVKAAPATQWRDIVSGLMNKGVKKDEIVATGILDWLDSVGGKVTKEDVLSFLTENDVVLVDTVAQDDRESRKKVYVLDHTDDGKYASLSVSINGEVVNATVKREQRVLSPNGRNGWVLKISAWSVSKPTKIESAEVVTDFRAGPDYAMRETVKVIKRIIKYDDETEKRLDSLFGESYPSRDDTTLFRRFTDIERDIGQHYAEIAVSLPSGRFIDWLVPYAHKFSHDAANTNRLLHARVDERVSHGIGKVLFVHEIQSDWAQRARDLAESEGKKVSDVLIGKNLGPAAYRLVHEIVPDKWSLYAYHRGLYEGAYEEILKNARARGVSSVPKRIGDEPLYIIKDGLKELTEFGKESGLLSDEWIDALNSPEGRTFYQARADSDHKSKFLRISREDALRDVPELLRSIGLSDDLLPAAPYITDTKSWVALAIKRIIAHAVEVGAKAVAWTSGEDQENRYGLARHIGGVRLLYDSIHSSVSLRAVDSNRRHIVLWGDYSEDEKGNAFVTVTSGPIAGKHPLEDVFGESFAESIKEAAAHVLADRVERFVRAERRLSSDGMRIFYGDERGKAAREDGTEYINKKTGKPEAAIVPTVARDVVRRLGGTDDLFRPIPVTYDRKRVYRYGFIISPEMEARVRAGIPKFSTAPDGDLSDDFVDIDGVDEYIETDVFGELPNFGDDAIEALSGIETTHPEDVASAIGRDMAKIRYDALHMARVGQALLAFAQNRSMFTYQFSNEKSIELITKEMSGGAMHAVRLKMTKVDRDMMEISHVLGEQTFEINGVRSFRPTSKYQIIVPHTPEQIRRIRAERIAAARARGEPADDISVQNESVATIYFDGKIAVANMINLKQNITEGALVYQIIATWAHNNGVRFIGDPAGLSERALFRRTEAMLASMLRTGTSNHLGLHNNQHMAGLRLSKNDTAINVGRFALWLRDAIAMHNGAAYAAAVQKVKFDGAAQVTKIRPSAKLEKPESAAAGPKTISRIAIIELFDRMQAAGKLPAMYVEDKNDKNVALKIVRENTTNIAPTPLYSIAPRMEPRGHSGIIDSLFEKAGLGLIARKLLDPAWGKLHEIGREGTHRYKLIDRVAQGLIADYGLPEPYLDAKIVRHANVNKVLRKSRNIIEHLAHLDREQSRIAYLWMSEKPDTELEKQLLAQLPDDSRSSMYAMKAAVDELGREAVTLGLLSEESYQRNRMAYLHRSYSTHLANKGDKFAAQYKRNAAIRGELFKGRGLRDDVPDDKLIRYTDEVNKGDLFVRFERRDPISGVLRAVEYVPLARARAGFVPQDMVAEGIWEARFWDKKNKVGMWRDLTKDERQRLGEIEEVRFAFAKTVLAGIRDIENARFLRWVRDNYSKDPDDVDAEKMVDAKEGFITLKTYSRDQWVVVPSTLIAGTRLRKYGDLAGRAIPAVMWNDIRNMMSIPESDLSALWERTLRWWKASKTALSPAVHMNNVMSNFIMADIADVRASDIITALATVYRAKHGDSEAVAIMNRYDDSGADYGSFASIELNNDFVKPLLDELSGQAKDDLLQTVGVIQAVTMALKGNADVARLLVSGGSTLAIPFRKLIELYQQEDTVFRIAKFMKEIKAGKSDMEAGKLARDSFLNYDINAPWIQTLRRSALPFIAFSYRAIPMMIETAMKKPWKIAKYYVVGSALNWMAYAMLGGAGDEDRERKLLPEEVSGRMFGIFPRLIRLPWNDEHGSPVFMDLRRWVPGGSMLDVQQSQSIIPVPDWLSVGGPLSLMAEFFVNKSQFTGKPIVDVNDTPAERAMKFGDWFFKAMAPNLPLPGPGYVIPGAETGQFQTYAWQGIALSATGSTDPFGREMSVGQAIASAFGVKAKSYPEDVLRMRASLDYREYERQTKSEISSLARRLARKGITQREYDEGVAMQTEKLRKKADELRARIGQ